MKKLLVALAMCIGSATQAQTFGGAVALYGEGVNGAPNMHGYQFVIGHRMNNLTVDANAETLIANTNYTSINRLEAGATVSTQTFLGLTPYMRAAFGSKTASGKQFNYYSAEPGVRLKLGPGMARLGWRYRDSVESGYTDLSRTWRMGYTLPLSNSIDLNTAYERSRGFMDYNGYMLGLTIKF